MQFGRIFDVLIAIVVVAGVAVALGDANTFQDISAVSTGFTNSLKAATLH